ncbi:hypothetical protein FBU30_006756 [Linnemannia zychae]|nr:hypothetical protein FBU30_006756 [Linnemannia zychae]
MNKIHPLEIPEILARVGRHVPLWINSNPSASSLNITNDIRPNVGNVSSLSILGPPYFDPRHLLACIQVNRTWYDIFLPILCFSFDDTAVLTAPIATIATISPKVAASTMNPSSTTTLNEIPVASTTAIRLIHPPAVRFFLRHSQLFRLLVLTRRCAPILALPPSQLPTHLLHLELVGLDDDTVLPTTFSHSLTYSVSNSVSNIASTSTSSVLPSLLHTSNASASSISLSASSSLSLSSTNEWSKALILQNTRLQSLRWQGGDFQRDNHGILDSLALAEKLHRLQDLVLECWKLDRGFMELLRKNQGLRTLALDFVTGDALPPITEFMQGSTALEHEGDSDDDMDGGSISHTHMHSHSLSNYNINSSSGSNSNSHSSPNGALSSNPLSLHKIPSASSSGAYTLSKSGATNATTGRYPSGWTFNIATTNLHNSSEQDNYFNRTSFYPNRKNPNPYGFQLLHLTCLNVCKDVESGSFESLLRLCPNLEELSWMGPIDSDLEALTQNLHECCPRVAVLTYSTVDVSEPEWRYAALLRSLPSLVDLQIRIPTLEGGHFARALLEHHAGSLEILDLRIVRQRRSSLPNANHSEQRSLEHLKRILMGCSELTALSIEGAERMSESLFLFTWACSHRLHRLFLAASINSRRIGVMDAIGDGDEGNGGGEVGIGGGDGGGGGGGGGGNGEEISIFIDQGEGQDQDQDEDQEEQETSDRSGVDGDDFVAEAAMFGWMIVGSSGPPLRHHRLANGTPNINANQESAAGSGVAGEDVVAVEEDGEVEEGEGIMIAENNALAAGSSSIPLPTSQIISSSSGHSTDPAIEDNRATHLLQSSSPTIYINPSALSTSSYMDDDSTLSTTGSTASTSITSTTPTPTPTPPLPITPTATISSSNITALTPQGSLLSSTASSSSSSPTTSFVRDMMHRLEDMPRLQSFVLNGVEYTRVPSLIAR